MCHIFPSWCAVVDQNWPWDMLQAVGALVQAVGVVAAAIIAWWQISALRRQQRGWETLKACERYDTDVILDGALKTLRDKRDTGQLKQDPRPYRLEMTIVLNYIEHVVIGVNQGFYDEQIVKDHLETIMRDHVGEFLDPDMARRSEIDKDDYIATTEFLDRWKKRQIGTKFL